MLCCAVLCAVILQMYCLLIRVEAGPEPNFCSYLVTNIVFLVGFFTLAVLLGELLGYRAVCSLNTAAVPLAVPCTPQQEHPVLLASAHACTK